MQMLLGIQEYIRNPICDKIFIFITSIGDKGFIWILLTILLLTMPKTRKVGILCAFALIGSLLINNILLKNLVCRARPYTVIENLQLLVKEQSDWSFPSGHAGSSFAVATVIFRNMSKKVGVPTLVLAFLIGFSRLYVGVHYMTDVLCGALLGVAIGIAVEVLCRKLKFISLH